MTGAREEILGRIRASLRDVPDAERPQDVAVAREYGRDWLQSADALVSRFLERVVDYGAGVRRVARTDVTDAVTDICRDLGLRRVVVPVELPDAWRPRAVEVLEDEHLTAAELDAIDGAITGCAGAIAETGTLVLDGQGHSGRRVVTLVPDHHVCIVGADQVRGSVPEAIAALAASVAEKGVPVTLVSGPSASSDIELSRVEGMHGPRNLVVVIVEDATA